MKKGISLVFITHEKLNSSLEYLNKLSRRISSNIPFYLIYDSYISKEDKKKFLKKLNKKIIFLNYGENIGKLKSILFFSKYFKTEYIKIVDHDDNIVWFALEEFNKKIKKIKNNQFVYHKAAKIFENSKFYGYQTIDKKILKEMLNESENVNYLIPPNAKVLYNTQSLRKVRKIKFYDQKYFDDNFLSLICQFFSKKTLSVNDKPYIQFHQYGQTSSFIFEEVENSMINYFKNLILLKNNYELNFSNSSWTKKSSFKWLEWYFTQFDEYKESFFETSKKELEKFWE
ncbi:MAG: hypothetical protein TYPL_0220 [Candidatus Tyloplasma litorale]|nr:MAG: hypothetical protein TYPL_0220 [Mycoplasmatales bacterium]